MKCWLVQSTNPTGKRTHIYWNPAHSPHPLWSFLFCFNTTKGTERKHRRSEQKDVNALYIPRFMINLHYSQGTHKHTAFLWRVLRCVHQVHKDAAHWGITSVGRTHFQHFLDFVITRTYDYQTRKDSETSYSGIFLTENCKVRHCILRKHLHRIDKLESTLTVAGRNLTTWMTVCLHKLLVANLFKKSFCFHGN